MVRPRSPARMLRDLQKHAYTEHRKLADALQMSPHRFRRICITPALIHIQEENALRQLHAATFPDNPDLGDDVDLPTTPPPEGGNGRCRPQSPDHSPENKPSKPSKTAARPTNNEK